MIFPFPFILWDSMEWCHSNLPLVKIFGIPTQTRLTCLLSDLKSSQGDNED